MVTCPNCAAIVFVDMEGFAHVASDSPAPPAEEIPSAIPESVPDSLGESLLEMGQETPPNVPMTFSPLEPFQESPAAEASSSAIPSDPNSDMDMNAFLGYAPAEPAVTNDVTPSQIDPKDPLGLSAYANSEMSSAQNGPLVVSLIISGIDAKDLRDEIRQALQDSRFGWDAGELLSKMTGGILRIDRISPVKATVVISRIKNLSVRIRWEQHAITEIDPVEKDP